MTYFRKILILLVVFFSVAAYADTFSYSTSVYFTDKSAEYAKRSALSLGRVVALSYVLKKITLISDNDSLVKLITPQTALSLNTGLQVNNEKIGKQSYQADITYNFNEQQVYKFLNDNNIKYVSQKLGDYLVIPRYTSQSSDKNIHDSDFWTSVWQNIQDGDYLSDFTYYQLTNEAAISNKTYLDDLAGALQIQEIYILTLSKNKDNTYDVDIKSLRNKKDLKLTGFESMDDIVSSTIQYIEEPYKKDILTKFSMNNNVYTVSINYSDLSQWADLRRDLLNINGVSRINILELGNHYVVISLKVTIPLSDIKSTLLAQGFSFDTDSFTITKSTQDQQDSNNSVNNDINGSK